MNRTLDNVNVSINMIPAPLGLPTDLVPLIAYALPASLGRVFLPNLMAAHVRANENNTLINVRILICSDPIK